MWCNKIFFICHVIVIVRWQLEHLPLQSHVFIPVQSTRLSFKIAFLMRKSKLWTRYFFQHCLLSISNFYFHLFFNYILLVFFNLSESIVSYNMRLYVQRMVEEIDCNLLSSSTTLNGNLISVVLYLLTILFKQNGVVIIWVVE